MALVVDSEDFQIPITGGSLILDFVQIPEIGGYYKNQIPTTSHSKH